MALWDLIAAPPDIGCFSLVRLQRNNYDLDVYNGELGVITKISPADKTVSG